MSDNDESDDAPEPQDDGAEGGSKQPGEPSYEIGKNKPPLHTRFKTGNKLGKGRKKGSKNLATIVNQAANLKTAAKIGGKVKKFTKAELAVYQLANKASAGDLKATSQFLDLVERYEPRDDPVEPSPEQLKPDVETLRDYLAFYDLVNSQDNEDESGDQAA